MDRHGVLLRRLLLRSRSPDMVRKEAQADSHARQMKPGVIREEYIAIIMRGLLKGLDYLHTEGKLHRDIKGQL